MWIALLVFCLFLLLVSFFLYGFHRWENLLADPDEDSEDSEGSEERDVHDSGAALPPGPPPGRFLALWVLLIGMGGIAVLEALIVWLTES